MRDTNREHLSDEMKAEIIRRMALYLDAKEAHNPKAIARDLCVHHNTVRNVWNQSQKPVIG